MKNEKRFYTGIGSRKAPKRVLELIETISMDLEKKSFVVRSGDADGCDKAFTNKIKDGNKHIYHPWRGFTENTPILYEAETWTYEIIRNVHNGWNKLKESEKKLHARNVHQVLGHQGFLNKSEFVILYAEPNKMLNKIVSLKGGTNSAFQLAMKNNIKVYNLYFSKDIEELNKFMNPKPYGILDIDDCFNY